MSKTGSGLILPLLGSKDLDPDKGVLWSLSSDCTWFFVAFDDFSNILSSFIQSNKLLHPSRSLIEDRPVDNEERPDMDFSDNGKDILMSMVSLSIPIFNKSYKSQTKQNELRQFEIIAQKQQRLNKLEALLDRAVNDRVSARISHNTQSKNLKEAKDAEQILLKNYVTGTIDFNDVLDIQELQLKFQMNQIESVKDYYVQTTIINYLSN